MSAVLAIVRRLPRAWTRRRILTELARATAGGFGTPPPTLAGPYRTRLAAYALWTAHEADRLIQSEARSESSARPPTPLPGTSPDSSADLTEVVERLKLGAGILGAATRRRLRIRQPEDAWTALRFLYSQIAIEISTEEPQATEEPAATERLPVPDGREGLRAGASAREAATCPAPGMMTVTKCFFSDYYTPELCRVMSAVDAGIVDGLFGGASLRFSDRISQGSACCRASVTLRAAPQAPLSGRGGRS